MSSQDNLETLPCGCFEECECAEEAERWFTEVPVEPLVSSRARRPTVDAELRKQGRQDREEEIRKRGRLARRRRRKPCRCASVRSARQYRDQNQY